MRYLPMSALVGVALGGAGTAAAQSGAVDCCMTLAECEAQAETLEAAIAACEEKLPPVQASDLAARVRAFRWSYEPGELTVRKRRNRLVVELPAEVLFDSGKTAVKARGRRALKEIATLLKTIDKRVFLVAGHTDNVPIAQKNAALTSNWQLSAWRAVAVVQILVAEGVPARQLGAVGYGEFQPVARNVTPAGKARNRRIEIVILPEPAELEPLPQEIGGEAPTTPHP